MPLRSILILSTHLRLGLPSGLFPSGFPTNTLYNIKYKIQEINLSATRHFSEQNASRDIDGHFRRCKHRQLAILRFAFKEAGYVRISQTWSWVLLEKPLVAHLLKNFQSFYGTHKLFTVFTRTLHRSISWARSIQSIPRHPISVKSFWIL
jgi:hypothetical protein